MKTPPTRLILILAGFLILAAPSRLAAQDTLDPKDVMAAPQRFWLQYYLFRDSVVDLPGGSAAIDFGDGPHYAFTTKGFRSMYATKSARDALVNLEKNREYLFRGTVQNKRGKYYYTVTEVMDVKEDPKVVVPPDIIGDIRALQANQALAQMLYKIQAGMLIYSQREGVSYKDLFNPESLHHPKLTQIVRDVVGAQERTPQNPSEILAISIKNALEGYYGDPNARKMEENIPAEVLLQVQAYVTQEQKAAIAAAANKSSSTEPTPTPAPPAPVPPAPAPEVPHVVPAPEPKVVDPNAFAPPKDSVKAAPILGNEPDDVLERMLNKSNTTSVGHPPETAPSVDPVVPEEPKAPAPVEPAPGVPAESLIPAPIVPAPAPEAVPVPAPEIAPVPGTAAEASIPVIGAAEPSAPAPEIMPPAPVEPAPVPTPVEPPPSEPAPVTPDNATPAPAEPVPAEPAPAEPAPADPAPAEVAPAEPEPAPAVSVPAPMPAELAPADVAPAAAEPQEKIEAVISTEELDRLMKELNIPVPVPAEHPPVNPETLAVPAAVVEPAPAPVPPVDPVPTPAEPAPVVPPEDPVPAVPVDPAPTVPVVPEIAPAPAPAPEVEVIPAPPSDALPVVPAPVAETTVPEMPAPVVEAVVPEPVAPKPPPLPRKEGEKKKDPSAKKPAPAAEKPAEKAPVKPAGKEEKPADAAKPAEAKPKPNGFYDPNVDFHFKNLPK